MSDKVVLTLALTPEENERIQNLAQQRGYESTEAYLLALVEWDAEDAEEDPEASFRQGWHEVMTGQTYPVSTLWDFLDDD